MPTSKRRLKTCSRGHKFYKSSDCPVCPTCEQERKPDAEFLSNLSVPARRALEKKGITTVKKLSIYSENEILDLHGIGPSSLPKLNDALKKDGLSFRKKANKK